MHLTSTLHIAGLLLAIAGPRLRGVIHMTDAPNAGLAQTAAQLMDRCRQITDSGDQMGIEDVAGARLTLITMELMGVCQQIHETGDRDGAIRTAQSAPVEMQERMELLRGGMMIGEVPRLASDAWPQFVENQRMHVARLEALNADHAPDCGSWESDDATANPYECDCGSNHDPR